MKIYDEVIKNISALVSSSAPITLDKSLAWNETDQNEIIFKNETAFELGESSLYSLSGIMLTSSESLVKDDEIVLIGQDLNEIKKDTPYARIVLARVNDKLMGEGNAIYQNIRKIDYTRYHIFPEGFMMRISSMNQRETVRVSSKALKKGMNFSSVGQLFIDKYKSHPAVEAVKIIFINTDDFKYDELSKLLVRTENITKALDHLVNKVKMDCQSCALQVVCNEVENMVKEDFKK